MVFVRPNRDLKAWLLDWGEVVSFFSVPLPKIYIGVFMFPIVTTVSPHCNHVLQHVLLSIFSTPVAAWLSQCYAVDWTVKCFFINAYARDVCTRLRLALTEKADLIHWLSPRITVGIRAGGVSFAYVSQVPFFKHHIRSSSMR